MTLAPRKFLAGTVFTLLSSLAGAAGAQTPSPADALKLTPVQKDVEFAQPAAADIEKCTLKNERDGNQSGWVVRDPNGVVLRKFIDTNGDNQVDLWCYFEDGLEVYRDIDSDQNGKVDQYRWLNTGGSRWGVDKNEDGRIDNWKAISAEEVSVELVAAIAAGDKARFNRLLITKDELENLGLSETHSKQVASRIEEAAEKFTTYLAEASKDAGGKLVSTQGLKWTHFSGSIPGIIPAGTNGATKDVLVYENVTVMVDKAEKHDQVPIGTMIKVGDVWRIVDAPAANQGDLASVFFTTGSVPTNTGTKTASGKTEEELLTELMTDLDKLDKALNAASTPGEQTKLNEQRTDRIMVFINASGSPENQVMWLRQLVDHASAAIQAGSFTSGIQKLEAICDGLPKLKADSLVSYYEFRIIMADYGQQMQAPNPDFVTIQKQLQDRLKAFVEKYPTSDDAADAMLQLGLSSEFAGQDTDATGWYQKIVSGFPGTPLAKKAAGAVMRLNSVGKVIPFQGQTIKGEKFNLAAYKGKVVVIHYWATWCEPCKADMLVLRELQAKHGRDLMVIGASLDGTKDELVNYLTTNKAAAAWPHLWDAGGLDSPLADQLGVLTLPTMILVDKQGKVANRNIHVTELDKEITNLLR